MHKYSPQLKAYMRKNLVDFRKRENRTQEQMAAQLHITVRSYYELEAGKSGLSAPSILFFLDALPDDLLVKTVRDFRSQLEESDWE